MLFTALPLIGANAYCYLRHYKAKRLYSPSIHTPGVCLGKAASHESHESGDDVKIWIGTFLGCSFVGEGSDLLLCVPKLVKVIDAIENCSLVSNG